jgi:4-alpha-glucanotransferase
MRASGILMHISSLPSKYGIGTFGEAAYRFVDFLEKAGQKYWQLLPVGPISYGDSPYSSFSTFAGNPYFIDLDVLCEEGFLKHDEIEDMEWGDDPEKVDYGKIFESRYDVLRIAYNREKETLDLTDFVEENKDWIEDYALYMALKFSFGLVSWQEWDEDIKKRTPEAMNLFRVKLKDDIDFFIYTQYKFFQQWKKLKAYANKKGIKFIGDIPIYVAADSSDTWSHPDLFLFDEKTLEPIDVAGCPPDAFSATGQLWGNPIYRWERHKETGYDWWTRRIQAALKLYDVVRIDHFRGFAGYYAIPYGEDTAINGEWREGPGIDIFTHLKKKLGKMDIIAEDLGYLTDDVRKLLKKSGYPGMKILQFAFDSREESDYLPHNYNNNCVVYTGTHDNDTMTGWFNSAPKADVKFAIKYLHLTKTEGYTWGCIRAAYMSVADLAIIPIQDFLDIGSEGRMNTPSTLGCNWMFRITEDALTDKLANKIADLVKTYSR